MDTHEGDSDRSPDLNDKLDQNQKLKDLDLEDQGRRLSHHHVTAIDSSSTSESVGRQIEMESENTIKYRTCSWQKVSLVSMRYDRKWQDSYWEERKGKRLGANVLQY